MILISNNLREKFDISYLISDDQNQVFKKNLFSKN